MKYEYIIMLILLCGIASATTLESGMNNTMSSIQCEGTYYVYTNEMNYTNDYRFPECSKVTDYAWSCPCKGYNMTDVVLYTSSYQGDMQFTLSYYLPGDSINQRSEKYYLSFILPQEKTLPENTSHIISTIFIIIGVTLLVLGIAGYFIYIQIKKKKKSSLTCDKCYAEYVEGTKEYNELLALGECPVCKNR